MLTPVQAKKGIPRLTLLNQTRVGPKFISYVFRCLDCDQLIHTSKKSTVQVFRSATPLVYLDSKNQTANVLLGGDTRNGTFTLDPDEIRVSWKEYNRFLVEGGVVQ